MVRDAECYSSPRKLLPDKFSWRKAPDNFPTPMENNCGLSFAEIEKALGILGKIKFYYL